MFGFFKKKEDNKPAYSPVENNTEENNIKDFSEKTKETLENVGDKTQETFDNAKEEISDLKDKEVWRSYTVNSTLWDTNIEPHFFKVEEL